MEHLLDKKSYKVLKIIYKHSTISKDKLFKKSKLKDIKAFNCILFVLNPFISNPYCGITEEGISIYDESIILISDKGKVYVENYNRETLRFRIPVIISITALIISLSSLLYNILK
jgi:hypothetical protein